MFKNNKINILAPCSGIVKNLSDVNDPVFSEKMMGDGIAIVPKSSEFVSPIDGEVVATFDTGHAYGITTKSGVSIIVHIGIDTVHLEEKLFNPKVKKGQKISAGDILCTVDLEGIKKHGLQTDTMILVTNQKYQSSVKLLVNGGSEVNSGDAIFRIKT